MPNWYVFVFSVFLCVSFKNVSQYFVRCGCVLDMFVHVAKMELAMMSCYVFVLLMFHVHLFLFCVSLAWMSFFPTILGFCMLDMACTCDVMELVMMIYKVFVFFDFPIRLFLFSVCLTWMSFIFCVFDYLGLLCVDLQCDDLLCGLYMWFVHAM